MLMKWTYKIFMNSQFKIQANCNNHVKFHRDLLIRSTSNLSLKNDFFRDFFRFAADFLRSMGAVPQNWLIPQQFHKNQNCRVSKSKIIMWHWFLVLKARKAAKWPRTLSMVFDCTNLRPRAHDFTEQWRRYWEWISYSEVSNEPPEDKLPHGHSRHVLAPIQSASRFAWNVITLNIVKWNDGQLVDQTRLWSVAIRLQVWQGKSGNGEPNGSPNKEPRDPHKQQQLPLIKPPWHWPNAGKQQQG